MKNFINYADVPIGYITPSFPSLYWPINNRRYDTAFLYFVTDIWKFTLYWTFIFNGAFYATAGGWASLNHWNRGKGLWIVAMYMLYAGVQAIIMGTIMGFLIGAIYRSGLFAMSTWVPMCCAVVQILLDVTKSTSIIGRHL